MIFNRNLYVAVLVAAMLTLGTRASLVTSNEVVDAVSAWASANGATFSGKRAGTAVVATPTYDDDGTTVLYWTVTMSNGGAVIASPDTDLDLVIAFLEKYDGPLPAGHPLLSILKRDLSNRLAVLAKRNAATTGGGRRMLAAAAAAQPVSEQEDTPLDGAVKAANAQWAKYGVGGGGMRLLGASLDGGDSNPYVRRIVDGFESGGRFTHWNQSGGIYNYLTPGIHSDTHNGEVCGCVATAGAAILQFFNCTNDPGMVDSPVGCELYSQPYECKTIAGETDWTALPAEYGGEGSGPLDDAGKELLGRATYNMGVLVGMSWASEGPGSESGSQTSNLVGAVKAYGFTTARYVAYSDSENPDGKMFMKTLYAQLWCGAPAAMSIRGEPGGHAVVACGYARDADGDEFCRVFMGWGGSGDNWYKFPNVLEFSQVNGAVTMIGYQDDAVVPVYGETNIPGEELTIPGYVTNGVTVTTMVNASGYFGVRVPIGLVDKTIAYIPRGKTANIAPFDSNVIADEAAGRADLDNALPNEIYFPVMNMTVKQTVASARAVAERDGKAMLLLCGTIGSDYMKPITSYIMHLDEVTDISNKFVYVVVSSASSNWEETDGDPALGVFDPALFDVKERWKDTNGRLKYENFIDYDESGETDEKVLVYSEDDTGPVTNLVDKVTAGGYDQYLRNHSGISVTVRGANLATWTFGDVATVSPDFGTHANNWTNGEFAVFTASGTCTNESAGVIYSCIGWSTNKVDSIMGLAGYTPGTNATIQLFSNDDVTLTWLWDVSHCRVTASPSVPYTSDGFEVEGAVTPSNAWVAVGTRATVTAQPTLGQFHFNQWNVKGNVDYDADDSVDLYENGTAVSFFVKEPVAVTANYRSGASGAPAVTTNRVVLVSTPAEIADVAPPPVAGGFDWGENITFDNVLQLQLASCVDATGGVWMCTNVVVSGVVAGMVILGDSIEMATYRFDPLFDITVTCEWVPYSTEGPYYPPLPVDPVPTAITITGIERTVAGTWDITISGAVKYCWYWLYSTDDLSKFAGDEATWTTTADFVEKKQAEADGDIVFNATGSGPALFWRARATAKEDGN